MWHLASVVSVFEPVYGLAAMKRSNKLLKGNTKVAMTLVISYLLICMAIGIVFRSAVIQGGKDHGVLFRLLVGALLIVVVVIVNFIGLLVQCVMYCVCRGYHRKNINKVTLHDHLGSYLGEYVPLASSVEWEM
ncbi:hypothetical protein IFM89_017637 [Coptis chinensis]|uniref:Uncharacterized protein n=1 Tax=Coptis chinensis TaxID=261450 RepID=A0A835H1E0_9MAGN|nr:hypothetical protein IFM89_017637 [Coptis chinensis]